MEWGGCTVINNNIVTDLKLCLFYSTFTFFNNFKSWFMSLFINKILISCEVYVLLNVLGRFNGKESKYGYLGIIGSLIISFIMSWWNQDRGPISCRTDVHSVTIRILLTLTHAVKKKTRWRNGAALPATCHLWVLPFWVYLPLPAVLWSKYSTKAAIRTQPRG